MFKRGAVQKGYAQVSESHKRCEKNLHFHYSENEGSFVTRIQV